VEGPVIAGGAPGISRLCVDADGVLLHSSLTLECLISAIRRRPWLIFALPLWALRGAAFFKRELAVHAELDPSALPYDLQVVLELQTAVVSGARIELITAADESIARQVADYLGFFTAVSGSLSPAGKRAFLADKTRDGYEIVAGGPSHLQARHVLALIRPGQWLKNALVFLPFLLAHDLRSVHRWIEASLAFIAFSAAASVSYVFNDVLDRYQDRIHPRRRRRPLASGEMPLGAALLLPIPLVAIAAACCVFLPWQCSVVLLWYLATTTFYSAVAKERLMADVIILALLYTSRLIFGSFATANVVSPWLSGFSLSLFLSLALCKRVSELIVWRSIHHHNALGRKYEADDIPILEMMAVTSGFLACLVMTLYIQSPEILVLYRHPHMLWVAVIGLLYWLGRLFLYTHRGKCPDDPLLFAVQDSTTLIVLGIAGVFVLLAV
jgi:4-hydroxybenzoate polyprenyltransferase